MRLSIPLPVLLAGGAALVLAIASAVAFRRWRPDIGSRNHLDTGGVRRAMHRSAMRLVQAAILAIGVSVIPLATVSACSCMPQELPEAIASADVAVVGTVASVEPTANADFGDGVLTTWAVTGSRDPMATGTIAIHSVANDGANCGISFGRSERWLVLAYRGEQGLETNGCMMNRRLDGGDAEAEALIAEAMTPVTAEAEVEELPLSIPLPVIGLGAAGLLVGLVSLLAFRRSAAS